MQCVLDELRQLHDHSTDAQKALDRCKCLMRELKSQLEGAPDAFRSMFGLVMYRVNGLMVESVMKLLASDTDGVQVFTLSLIGLD